MKKTLFSFIISINILLSQSLHEIPAFEKRKVEQTIQHKLKAYGDFESYGYTREADAELKHEVVGIYVLSYGDGRHILIVMSTVPNKNYNCHACDAKLSFFEFSVQKNKWRLIKTDINTVRLGSWG